MKKIWRKILDVIFPKRCVGCNRSGSYICAKCASLIPPCAQIEARWIISTWSYKDPRVKKLLWKFKFENKFSAASDIALYASDHLVEELSERAIFDNFIELILVPVPLTKKSLRKRGYNQSKLLAEEIMLRLGPDSQVEDTLTKVRETETQHSIKNRRGRLQNLRGAYAVNSKAQVFGKNILLIDDITTTHATLIEARRALKAAGAKKVLAYTIAH